MDESTALTTRRSQSAISGILSAILAIGLGVTLLIAPGQSFSPAVLSPEISHKADYQPWGRAWAPDQVLRQGCIRYRLRYRVRPPDPDWLITITVRKRNGAGIASVYRASSSRDPKADRVRFRVCRTATNYGRHRVAMQVTWFDDEDEPHTGRVRPTTFRFLRP